MGFAAAVGQVARRAVAGGRANATKFGRYAKVELTPPRISDIPEIRSRLGKLIHSAQTGGYRNLTVREAWINTLIGIEIWCWFFVGECIGKRNIIGYDV